MKKTFNYLVILSALVGLAIAWNDSQPGWDDTGITVFMILFAAAIFGFLAFEKPWLIALLVSIWIPLWAIISTHNYGGFIAVVPGFAGSYLGYYFRKILAG